jgi:FlaA1/EpsC-like NDP-sugar epimerase
MKNFIFKLANPALSMPRLAKQLSAICFDISLCILTVWLAYYLRLGEFVALSENAWISIVISIGLAIPIFIISGLYQIIFRYTGWSALLAVARAIAIYGLLYASIFTAIGVRDVPRTIGIIQPILLMLFVGVSRLFVRIWLTGEFSADLKQSTRSRVLVYGAGISGRQLVAAMEGDRTIELVGFLDDDHSLQGRLLNGLTIYSPTDLKYLASTLSIDGVLLAMPSISRNRRNEILNDIQLAQLSVRTLPSMTDLAQGRVRVSDLLELDVDDLLGREPVTPNHALLSKNVKGRVIMVTGAGGSIGSELCRQIISIGPAKLLLIEQSEFALYTINNELEEAVENPEMMLVPLLASVQDEARMHEIFAMWHPNTVYHVAAYKHVPLVECNPVAGIKNNTFGTLCTAKAAAENGVDNFVLISTDKAVRPANVMGASKRLAEMILQALAAKGNYFPTKFSIVRFGNVLDSSGSVVPIFRKQISNSGQITLTHLEVTRYFMTIPEAAQLVIQASAMAEGGDVFVLDMGEPVRIYDLAVKMINLSGLLVKDEANPHGDIEIKVTGLRSGEKLFEELLIGDNPQPTAHPRIMKAHEDFLPWSGLQQELEQLNLALDASDTQHIRAALKKLIPGYLTNDD